MLQRAMLSGCGGGVAQCVNTSIAQIRVRFRAFDPTWLGCLYGYVAMVRAYVRAYVRCLPAQYRGWENSGYQQASGATL